MFTFFRRERDHLDSRSLQHAKHFFTASGGEVPREKSPVAYDDTHTHFFS
jgi:hypothetical protein